MRLKKMVSLFLALAMTASMIGCGDGKETSVNVIDKEHVYSYENLELPVKLDNINGIFGRNDRIYLVGMSFGEHNSLNICSVNQDGTDAKNVELKTGFELPVSQDSDEQPYVSTSINYCAMDDAGSLIAIADIYREYQNENGEDVSENKQYLMKWNADGEQQWSQDLRAEGAGDGDFYVTSMFCDKDGVTWIFGQNRVLTYDAQGTQTMRKEFAEDLNGSLYMDKEGNLFLSGWSQDYTKQYWKEFDKTTMVPGAEKEVPATLFNYSVIQDGNVYDFALVDASALYGYNIGDVEPVKIMDFIDSDLASYGFNQVGLIDDTHFVAAYNDPITWKMTISLFTKVPPEEVVDKTPITLAAMSVYGDLKARIVEFNKTNPKYRIQVREYRTFATAGDYYAGYTQMNNDIIAGKIPDILLIDGSMPIDSYISKGLLTDFYPLIEEDPELNREDYLENIFEAYSVDGKMYQLVTGFSVSSVIGKTSIVGDREGWNMQEFEELMATMPEGTQSFSNMTRESVIYMGMMMTKNEYVDRESGKCSFDSPGFISFLEFVSQFPESTGEASSLTSAAGSTMDWQMMESAYRENRTILMNRYLAGYQDFNRAEKGDFGEDVTLIGFPTEGKCGNAIMPDLRFALAAGSKNQDGAWEFVRYYLTDEYQNQVKYQFPVKKSALELKEQEATDRPYWLNEEGEKQFYDDYVQIGGVDIKLDPLTKEEAAEFTEFLKSLTLTGEYDQSMIDIIFEEAAPYFEGQKSAEEVAKIIQSRVQLYINESK